MTMNRHTLRLYLVPLVLLFVLFDAGAQSTDIQFGGESMTVGEMMSTIERQTDYRFSYNKTIFDASRTVIVPRRNLPLDQALEIMTRGQGVKPVIHKSYIAIVPAADNSRPQIRKQQQPPAARTSDTYRPGDPEADPRPVLRPAVQPPTMVEVPIEPEERNSDYSPAAIYGGASGRLPRFAMKTNILYGGATLTPNIAVEAALSPRWTIEAAYSSNPWNYKAPGIGVASRKLLHGVARLEGRYWFCERFSRHFAGVHALYSEYNVSGHNIPMLFEKAYRYKGNAWGGGLVWGYDLPVGKSWNIEFTAGVGVYRMNYRRYSCLTCSEGFTPQTKTWFGPSRLGVSIEFLIK